MLSQNADAASTSSQKYTEDVRAYQTLRLQWQRSYKACKRGVEAVMLLAERESELKFFLMDLHGDPPPTRPLESLWVQKW